MTLLRSKVDPDSVVDASVDSDPRGKIDVSGRLEGDGCGAAPICATKSGNRIAARRDILHGRRKIV